MDGAKTAELKPFVAVGLLENRNSSLFGQSALCLDVLTRVSDSAWTGQSAEYERKTIIRLRRMLLHK